MIRTGENRNTGRGTSANVTLSGTNIICKGLRSKPGLSVERPATDRLNRGTAFERQELGWVLYESAFRTAQ